MGTQSLTLVAVLPLILTRLSAEEIAVYYLFATVLGFQAVFQLGFQPTFVRLVGFALGGRDICDMDDLRTTSPLKGNRESVNQESLETVCSSMRYVNLWLGIWTLMFLGIVGSLAMARPIGQLGDSTEGWLAWGVVVSVTAVSIANNGYQAYLMGANHIALSQRWQALFNLASILSMFIALTLAPSLLVVVVVYQTWILLGFFRYRQLCRFVTNKEFSIWSRKNVDRSAIRLAWSRSWRSGFGQLSSNATQQSLGIIYAQFSTGGLVASYLLGMRLIKVVERFAMAPFYSKLPLLNRLRSAGDMDPYNRISIRGIAISHFVYLVGFSSLAVLGPSLFELIKANAPFPRPALWYALGIAFFLQRFGGNHIQLYSTTNHIIWHWVNGIQGVIIVLSALVLGPIWGDMGFAMAILLGNLAFAVLTAFFSYRILDVSPLRFELSTSVIPIVLLGTIAALEWQIHLSSRASCLAQLLR